MSLLIRGAAILFGFSLLVTSGAAAQTQTPTPAAGAGTTPGREILQRKCAQCHTATMWTALKQDRRAWESTLYRMVGRGALWTPEEIGAMADYLAQIRGSASATATADKPGK
jgi:mono/diheme cytochrome c family protein